MTTVLRPFTALALCLLACSFGIAQMSPAKPAATPARKLTPAEDFKDTLEQYRKIEDVFNKKEKEYDPVSSRLEKQAAEIKEGRSKGPLDTVSVCKMLAELNRLHVSNYDWYDLMFQGQSDIKDNVELRFAWSGVEEMYPAEEEKINSEDKLWGCGITKNSIKGQPGALSQPPPPPVLTDRQQLSKDQLEFDRSYKAYTEKLDAAVKVASAGTSSIPAQCSAFSQFVTASNSLESVLNRLNEGVTSGRTAKVGTAAELAAIKTVLEWRSAGFAQAKANALQDMQNRSCPR